MLYKEKFEELNKEMNEVMDRLQNAKVVNHQMARLKSEVERIGEQLNAFHEQLKREKVDVERLKGLSLTNLYHSLLRDKTEQLEKEEQEVLQVKLQIDRLASERHAQQMALDRLKLKKLDQQALEDELKLLMEQKKLLIEEVQPDVWHLISEAEAEIRILKLQNKEIDEALAAGKRVLGQVKEIQQSLDSAAGWGTFDMMGGGLLATMAKRGHLDEAQQQMLSFQNSLRSFNRELQDVGDGIEFSIAIDGFLSFADFFFDGFFVDWAVQAKINDARQQMELLEQRVKQLTQELSTSKNVALTKIESLREYVDNLVSKA